MGSLGMDRGTGMRLLCTLSLGQTLPMHIGHTNYQRRAEESFLSIICKDMHASDLLSIQKSKSCNHSTCSSSIRPCLQEHRKDFLTDAGKLQILTPFWDFPSNFNIVWQVQHPTFAVTVINNLCIIVMSPYRDQCLWNKVSLWYQS